MCLILKKVFSDTNVLMSYSNDLFKSFDKVYICGVVLQELDKHKMSSDENRKFQAREATRNIEKNEDKVEFVFKEGTYSLPTYLDKDSNDNKIINVLIDLLVLDKDIIALSNDLNFRQKCKLLNVPCEKFEGNSYDNSYTGYKEVVMDDYSLATFYECQVNKWGLLNNEYLVIKNENDEIIDKLKWTEKGFKNISYKTVDSRYVGKVKPRNSQQELYTDILQDKESKVKVVQGVYGSGKDYLALANFLNMIEKGQYQKIIWIRNNIEANDTKPIGYLPGSLTEKLSVFADIVGDFVGDKVGFEMLLQSGKLELVHTGFLRGRDLRNSIIYCTEAQNMSDCLVKLILSRISEGSIAFFNGDIKQIDDRHFKTNNGLELLINKLKGNPLFGYVYLDKCERSEVAQLASLLD